MKLIVTSGPTREYFDPIRFLSNPSTGRMGYYIAKAGINRGLEVVYICGPVSSDYQTVDKAKNISIISTRDMLRAVINEIDEGCILIMAAAPADYRPEHYNEKKIKKTDNPSISLVQNPDILKTINEYRSEKNLQNVKLIGFAAETHDAENYAKNKLIKKNLDLICLNDLSNIGSGFGVDTNRLTIIYKDLSQVKWDLDSKERLGYKLIDEILNSF